MNEKSYNFVRSFFGEYYKRYYFPETPSTMEKREFGFNLFEGFMLRHKSFSNPEELRKFLETSTPMDAYYSCAYYENPTAEMDQKGWLGADLIFDVDADHIPTGCDKVHDEWICVECGFVGKGLTPENCPVCNGEKFNVTTWPCEICLESAKAETIKLLDMLMDDLGFSDEEIKVFFSGHRGYHVQIESEEIFSLDAAARKEIVDYVTGLGFNAEPPETTQRILHGWSKRVYMGVLEFIYKAEEDDLRKIGIRSNVARAIIQNKGVLLKDWPSEARRKIKGLGPETIKRITEHVCNMQSAKIDTVVTTDIHRLIRLPETLHGKTGLKKTWLPVNKIESFDPFKTAVAFKKGTVSIFVSDAPEFRLGDETFGPYKNQKITLPTAAAMLLICKGKAEVIE
ncbi:MAG: DNA primase small subunit PriS [Candidatus Parvarchaeum sp.]|nr:DNA primase small subunit PriS [Candidatus Parvarchaeum tengchongense]